MFEDSRLPERRGHLETLKAPIRVRVDLTKVYPVDSTTVVEPDGTDLQATVPGLLKMWNRTTTGHRLAWVSFTISSPRSAARVGTWVLADAIRPREGEPTERELHAALGGPVIWRE